MAEPLFPGGGSRPLSILVVHFEMPFHDRDSGSVRLYRTVQAMVELGHRVTYLAWRGLHQDRYADDLRALGVEVHPMDAGTLRAEGWRVLGLGIDLPALLRRGRFDLAWLSFYEIAERYLPQIRSHSPATRILIDTHDVHYLRERRGAELSGDPAKLAAAEHTRRREEAIYGQADALNAVSEEDARALRELVPHVEVGVVSNIHDEVPAGPGFDERSGIVFVGNFAHVPNVDAMVAFAGTTWPHVRAALPGAHLTIVGYQPPPEVQALAGGDVTVTGWVAETAPYLEAARVSIAPLRYGAGVKGKIGEALSHGLPVVTTPIGAEGMDLVHGESALVAEMGPELAEQIVRAHEDRELWERLSAGGRDLVDRTLSPEAARRALGTLIERIVPRCFVSLAGLGGERLGPVLGGYLGAFAAEDPVTLVLPLRPGDPPLEQAGAAVAAAVAGLGHDPEDIPDVSLVPCDDGPALPAAAVAVAAEPVARTPTLSPGAAPDAWRAAAAGQLVAPEPGDRPRASIVVDARGEGTDLERCLAPLPPALGGDVELVLVGEPSTLPRHAGAQIVSPPANDGDAAALNAGAAAARGRVLIFLDVDAELRPGALEALVDEAGRPGVGAVGALLRLPDGRIRELGWGWRMTAEGALPYPVFRLEDGALPPARGSYETSMIVEGCLAVPAHLFGQVGGFDEDCAPGWELADLCFRLRETGAAVRCRGDAEVVHHREVRPDDDHRPGTGLARFAGRWGDSAHGDEPVFTRAFGARLRLSDPAAPADAPGGAPLLLAGPVAGLGPDGAEARAWLSALAELGVDVAARTPAPSWLGPVLDDDQTRRLVDAHAREARPGAAVLAFGDTATGEGRRLLRLAGTPATVDPSATALVPTETLAAGLRAAGWPADRVEVVPPPGIPGERGPGGEGLLVLLPTHERAVTDALVAVLAELEDTPVRIVPTVRTPELGRRLALTLPAATLLAPVSDEAELARIAAAADAAVAVDPTDGWERGALTCAATGAATVVRPGGPAAELLGELAHTADPEDPAALAAAIRAALADKAAAACTARADAVDRARRLASERIAALAGGTSPEHGAGIAAFARGDLAAAHEHLERALAGAGDEPDPELLNDLAVVRHAHGDAAGARELLERCLELAPGHAGARENLAAMAAAEPDQRRAA